MTDPPNIARVPQRPIPPALLGARSDRQVLDALQRITDAALAFLTEDELLQELLRRVAEILEIDTVAILLLEGDTLHARAAKGIEEEVEQGVRIPVGRGFAGRIAAERRAIAITDVDHADILNPILREKGIQSLLGVPLLVAGPRHRRAARRQPHPARVLRPRSATCSSSPRTAPRSRSSTPACCSASGRPARRRRPRRGGSSRSSASPTPRSPTCPRRSCCRSCSSGWRRPSPSTPWRSCCWRATPCTRAPPRASRRKSSRASASRVGRGFAGRIAAEGRTIAITDVDHADIYNPILREKGIKSLLGVPLLAGGASIGVLHVGSLTPREFDDDERALLQFAAERAALAIEHARLYEQRRVAEVLQRRLLPAEIGNAFGLESSARYLPAAGGSLGGDWYDVFTLAGGRVALAVGDVVGHGVEAAAIMAQLRTAVRAYAADGHPPAAVVDRVNSLMQSHGPLAMTTLVCLVIDPATETLEIVNAGHPPALVVDPSGTASYCWPQTGVPLGASADEHLHRRDLPAPDRLDRARLHRRPGRAAHPSRSTSASSGCGHSPRARATPRACARRSSSSWSPRRPATTSRSSPPACRRWPTS